MQPVRIDDLFKYRFLSSVQYAPNGKWLAFLCKQADVEANGYTSNLYLASPGDDTVTQLTSSGKDGPFAWAPDGNSLFFLSRRKELEKGSHVYQIAVTGGEATIAFKLPHKAEMIVPMEDGSLLYTARVPLDGEPTKEDADYEVLEEIPFWQNGKGYTSRRRVRLFHLAPGADTPSVLTEEELEVQGLDVSAQRVALIARRFPGKALLTDELWLFESPATAPVCLSSDKFSMREVRFLDDDTLVLAASDMQQYGRGQNAELLCVEIPNPSFKSLTPDWDRSLGNSVAADCRHGGGPALQIVNQTIYATITEGGQSKVVRIHTDGTLQDAAVPNGSVDSFSVQGETIACIALRPQALQELLIYEGGTSKQMGAFNAASLADRAISLPKPFSVTTEDGTALDAWIIEPIDLDPQQKVPTVLDIHGGPRGAYGEIFFHEMQLLASEGYAVIYTNPRGSSGKGNAFADLRGKYGTIDYDDLMAVVDAAVDRFPFVDAERLGVMGGSYGGYMTNWMIGQTDRFRAAASQRSIANWTSKFNTTDIGYYFNKDAIGCDPWEPQGADKLWWHSPLKYADRVKTPTLFIHSEEDYRCWLAEGLQMFTALRYHGVESRLVLFRDENHELSRSGKPKHRARRLREIVSWFDRYLKNKETNPCN